MGMKEDRTEALKKMSEIWFDFMNRYYKERTEEVSTDELILDSTVGITIEEYIKESKAIKERAEWDV